MDAAALRRLFEPFYSTKEEAGTGLGLSISRRIVELHGGTIESESESEPGKGALFRVKLPAAAVPRPAILAGH